MSDFFQLIIDRPTPIVRWDDKTKSIDSYAGLQY